MEAIILAGGFGTRLRHIISEVPKPMAPVSRIPFLQYIFEYLLYYQVDKVILAVGYKKEMIMNFFGDSYKNIKIIYSIEEEPLYTGGAIKKALSCCNEKDVFVVNGDTFFNVNLHKMRDFHINNNADLSIAVKKMNNFERYGTVKTCNYRIVEFVEKVFLNEGLINGGVYCIKRRLLDSFNLHKFSFEEEFMKRYAQQYLIYAFPSKGYFIDIGIPEDYAKAQKLSYILKDFTYE